MQHITSNIELKCSVSYIISWSSQRTLFLSVLDGIDGAKEAKGTNKLQQSIKVMKEKISLLSKRGKKLLKKEKKLKSSLDKFKGKTIFIGLWLTA